jgi:CRP-like cAMP-binding protein
MDLEAPSSMNPPPIVSEEPVPTATAIVHLLQCVELFEMLSDADLERVIAVGQVRRLNQGDYLFKGGEPPDSIHVILAGAIEVVRSTPDNPEPTPVAYISPGEAIGDMALFTGAKRRSAGRVPEFVDVHTMPKPAFKELARSIPGYGLDVAGVFAKRLEGFINQMRGQKRQKELSGKLKFFDLPTVVQTLVSANQTGVLAIVDDKGKTVAEVLLRDGAVERARFGLLEGEEAFYQLFYADDRGEFFFRTVREPNPDSISEIEISLSAMNLLMEAARLVDELGRVRRGLPDPDKPYQARTDELQWGDDESIDIAREVLAKLQNPRRIADLLSEVPASTYRLFSVAVELFKTGQIG